MSSDEKTCIGEIRPHPGHYISTGQFCNSKPLICADFRFIDLYKYYKDQETIETFKFLRDLSNDLSIPVLPEEQGNYMITQFIADIIRQLGFDGILFKSSVSSGFNLVAFEGANFNFQRGSGKLSKITTLNYDYKEVDYSIDGFLGKIKER